ncbi:GNAT family N-acetyltransferase [Sphingopyxis solisilvae]|uniref:GNAT family N-acetyltransferase n=1 Tax=Sphingopyxis solisilvae TaxID=1886788 RepID=UPI001892A284|nr:GNAT family N-acetyltransferase [Sphingopyxis solisilvae]
MRIDPDTHWENDIVRLAVLTPDDVGDAYVGWLNDPEVNRYLESRFAVHDRAAVAAYVKSMFASPVSLFLAIHSKALGRHVGNIKIGPIDRHHGLGEIGLMIGARDAWGRGIATHAIAAVAQIGFRDLGLRKLTAGCYADNRGSRIAFERAGFTVEGIRRAHFVSDGRFEDLVLLARFADN